MARIQQLFSLTSRNTQQVSPNLPKGPLGKDTSLVSITPSVDGTAVADITYKFQYGSGVDDVVEGSFSQPELVAVLSSPGDDLVSKILFASDQLSKIDREYTLNLPSAYGDTQEQKLVNSFLVGFSTVLTIYSLLTLDQSKIDNPFERFKINLPITDISPLVITSNLGKLVNQTFNIISHLPSTRANKSWARQHVDFWNIWGKFLPEGPEYPREEASHKSLINFAEYMNERFSDIVKTADDTQQLTLKTVTTANQNNSSVKKETLAAIKKQQDEATGSLTAYQQSLTTALGDYSNQCQSHLQETYSEIDTLKHQAVSQIKASGDEVLSCVEEATRVALEEIKREKEKIYHELEVLKSENTMELNRHCDGLQVQLTESVPKVNGKGVDPAMVAQMEAAMSQIQTIERRVMNGLDSMKNTANNDEMMEVKKTQNNINVRINKMEGQLLKLTEAVEKVLVFVVKK